MPLTVFGISNSVFQRDQKKIPLLVRTFRGELSTGLGKDFEKTPSSDSRWERYFVHSRSQMVAAETKLFMRASSEIFKMFLQVVADGIGVLGSALRKNLSQ